MRAEGRVEVTGLLAVLPDEEHPARGAKGQRRDRLAACWACSGATLEIGKADLANSVETSRESAATEDDYLGVMCIGVVDACPGKGILGRVRPRRSSLVGLSPVVRHARQCARADAKYFEPHFPQPCSRSWL